MTAALIALGLAAAASLAALFLADYGQLAEAQQLAHQVARRSADRIADCAAAEDCLPPSGASVCRQQEAVFVRVRVDWHPRFLKGWTPAVGHHLIAHADLARFQPNSLPVCPDNLVVPKSAK